MNCELMLTYDTPALRQTGSRNLMGPKTLPTIWGTYMKLVTKYQISAINSCWEKCDDKCAYMFNVYKNLLSRQTGSRNLTGPKTLPTIWVTYMKLVTKYQISVINSCWEKCDEKCAYMFNVYKNQLSRQTGSRNLTGPKRYPQYGIQYTQGHIVVDHLQRRTACHVWLGVYRCLLIAHLLCEYLIVAKLGVVNLYLKVIKLWLTCTCSCIYLITHYNFNSIILDK